MKLPSTLKLHHGCALLLAIIFGLNSVGCSTESMFKKPPTALATGETPIVGDQFYTIDIKSDWGKTRSAKEALTGPIQLQEVLEKSHAIPRFGAIEVTIYRVVPESGQRLKLTADFDGNAKRIVTHQDYQIRPNDHITVKPSSKTPLDDLMAPFSQLTGS